MRPIQTFNLRRWIDENRHLLKPPVGNKQVFKDASSSSWRSAGRTRARIFTMTRARSSSTSSKATWCSKTMQDGKAVDVNIREGDVLLLPPHVPHSPQRFANTVGLVVERQRRPGEQDGFLWYCENCSHELYSEYFELKNIETELPPVFERFFASLDKRTCKHCGAVMQPPKRA